MTLRIEQGGWKKVSASFQDAEGIVHAGQLNKPGALPRTKSNERACLKTPLLKPIALKDIHHPMFKPEQIRELLTAKDFKPFVIHLSDGAHYEITNHDMVLVGRNDIHIGIGLDQVGIAERFVRCAIMHITRLEDLQAA